MFNVLNVYQETYTSLLGDILTFLFIMGIFASAYLFAIASLKHKELQFYIALISLFVFIIMAIEAHENIYVKKQRTIYEITIEDNMNMSEFLEQYEIIDQRGQIYVIKEREK